MVFQHIGDDFTTIFSDMRNMSLLSVDEIQNLNDIKLSFDGIKSEGLLATDVLKDFVSTISNDPSENIAKLVPVIEKAASAGNKAELSFTDMFSTILNPQNTKGLSNVSKIIGTFNNLDPKKQKDWANAVGQSNKQLGQYLGNIKNGQASLLGYGASLVGATAKTIALEAATTALNATISFGISIAIQGLITWISSLIMRENDLAQAAKDAAGEVKETNDILDDYAEKIVKLRDELDSGNATLQRSTEIRKELMEVQNDLIRKYGLESEGIDLVTGSVEKQIQAIKNLKKTNFEDYFDKNQEAVENAVTAMNNQTLKLDSRLYKQWYQTDSKVIADTYDKIGEIIKNSGFDFKKESGLWTLTGDIYTIDEALDYLQDKIQELGKQRGLSNEMVESYRTAARYISEIRSGWVDNQVLNQYGDIYDQWVRYGEEYTNEYFALVEKRANYELAVQEGNAERINKTKKEYLEKYNKIVSDDLKKTSPATAKVFEKEFKEIADVVEKQSSLIRKYIGSGITSGYEAQIKNFLEGLSIDDLDIANKIPNLFENGLEGATQKIKEWKSNPDNQIKEDDIVHITPESLSKEISDKVKLITAAMKDMSDEGYITSGTYADLIEKGGNYTKCLEIIDGKLTLNVDKLKELEIQEYNNIVAENNHQIAMLNMEKRYSSSADAIQERIDAIEQENAAWRAIIEDIRNAGKDKTKSSKKDDPIKEAFEKDMKDIEHLHNMGLKSDEEYYDALEKANEKHYKNSVDHESDYLSNVEKIYKARQSLYKEDADKQFDSLDEQFKAGKISAEAYAKALIDLGNSLYGEGTLYAGTEAAKKELESLDKKVKEVADDIYSEFKESLGRDGDLSLDNVLKDAEKLSKKNVKLFSDDPKTLKKNAEDIFSAVADSAKDALDKMLITPERYLEIIDEWGKKLEQTEGVIAKAKELSESDYLDAWDLENGFDSKKSADKFKLRAERIKYIFELAEQLYGKDGQDNVKAYNELIKQGLEDEQSLVEDYYDKEIEKLEKINDEEEKRQKAIELQMNLIKARQKLEDAKKQKNQLVFHNGTFEYMADQDAVNSAQDDVLEAEKAILEQQVEDQKEALEERKKAVSKFFNKVEGDVSGALNRIEKFLSGDTSVYEKAPDKKDKDNSSDKLANRANSVIGSITDLSEPNAFEKLISLFGGKPTNNSMKSFMDSFAATLIGKQIIPSTVRDAITNNSNTTNNTAKTEIHIDKIFENLNMPQGTTKEQVEEFFKLLNSAILQRIPQALIEVSK